jgi:hypothetical protein
MNAKKESTAPVWIWYPGDYEIWLSNRMQNRRTERGAFFPPFWKMDSHYVLVEFSKTLNLKSGEDVEIFAEGQYNIKLDGKLRSGTPNPIHIPTGRHSLHIKVYNQANVPSILVKGKTVCSDKSWLVTCEDKEWIDESGKASDAPPKTAYVNVGSWNFDSPDRRPSLFQLATQTLPAARSIPQPRGILWDFGKETFGYLLFHHLQGSGAVKIYYGESKEEALDAEHCETLDQLSLSLDEAAKDYLLPNSRAFRYAYIETDRMRYDSLSIRYEYLPLEYRGQFRCNNDLLNRISDVSAYTLHLTTRECFIDGIKRDRWVWSGDACQSYLMNYYLFFDLPSVERTLLSLGGKDPVTSHINTIMDYTFFWFISIYDYYRYSGNLSFIKQIYPQMKRRMDFCLNRRNANGMMEGLDGDWVFIDWADFPMSKSGEVSFEQLLFYRSLEAMTLCADLVNRQEDRLLYRQLAAELFDKLFSAFWSTEKQAFVHIRENGLKSDQATPFTNLFAVIFNCLDHKKAEAVKQNVLLNPQALKITTPYMRFYELEALCLLGEHCRVLQEICDYWGGMLRLGATTFWEKYNPAETGTEHFAMYGRPYGKSLCHAWGAGPLYLLGKYYLGVQPEEEGYKTFSIRPTLAGLQWIEGVVPTPRGEIKVYRDARQIRVSASEGQGFLYFTSAAPPVVNIGIAESIADHEYRLPIDPHQEYLIKLSSN